VWQPRQLAVVFIALALAIPASATDHTQVTVDSGPISGVAIDDALRVYRGVPFAAPPVGANRWRAPQPVEPWTQIRRCIDFGSTCPQSDAFARRFGMTLPPMSEDCLYLNVWAPISKDGSKLPVMVWIHGGGFAVGNSATYDGDGIARQGAVVVTINYRVGLFGFLPHRTLADESGTGSSGNYGLLDIIAALKWVQRNIDTFGGDPANVTIFGQSSGGTATCYMLASPLAKGLFHRAISQSSGAYDLVSDREVAEAEGDKLFQALGATGSGALSTMRQKSWKELLDAAQQARLRYSVILDGSVLREQPVETFLARRQFDVPLLIGSNANEADDEYTVAARFFAREHSRLNPNTFRYFFSKTSGERRAVHAAEISYVFSARGRGAATFDDSDRALAKTMSGMWVQFARSGDPNPTGQPRVWPNYDTATDPYLEFGTNVTVGRRLRTDICDGFERMLNEELAKRSK
jgi:para-nitrobenzyl esterase